MSPMQQIFLGLGAGTEKTYVDNVFSTFVYAGDGGNNRVINNNIDMTEGGLIWTKARNDSSLSNYWYDTVRGQPKRISRVIMGLDSSLSSTLEGSQIILRQVTDDFSIAPSTFTGLKEFYVLGYARDRSITIKQTDPLPMRVTGLVMEYGY